MVIINGRVYPGSSLSISGSDVGIDGKTVSSLAEWKEKEINITINGGAESVSVEVGNITVHGDVTKSVKNTNGDIEITGSVGGVVKTTNGSIDCGAVSGDVDTVNGNSRYKK